MNPNPKIEALKLAFQDYQTALDSLAPCAGIQKKLVKNLTDVLNDQRLPDNRKLFQFRSLLAFYRDIIESYQEPWWVTLFNNIVQILSLGFIRLNFFKTLPNRISSESQQAKQRMQDITLNSGDETPSRIRTEEILPFEVLLKQLFRNAKLVASFDEDYDKIHILFCIKPEALSVISKVFKPLSPNIRIVKFTSPPQANVEPSIEVTFPRTELRLVQQGLVRNNSRDMSQYTSMSIEDTGYLALR